MVAATGSGGDGGCGLDRGGPAGVAELYLSFGVDCGGCAGDRVGDVAVMTVHVVSTVVSKHFVCLVSYRVWDIGIKSR